MNFYTRQEIAELKQIAALPKGTRRESIEKFAKKSGRGIQGVYYKIVSLKRKEKGIVRKTSLVQDATLATTPNSKKGEFVIPVKNWKLQHENGNLNIVINF